jgi:hypothetical protein
MNAEQSVLYKYLPYLENIPILISLSYTQFAFSASSIFLLVRCFGDVFLGAWGHQYAVRHVHLHATKMKLFSCGRESYLTGILSISKSLEDVIHSRFCYHTQRLKTSDDVSKSVTGKKRVN